jgi:hypothetical protein
MLVSFFFFLVTDRFPGPALVVSWGWPRGSASSFIHQLGGVDCILRRHRPGPSLAYVSGYPTKDRRCVRSKAWLRAHANVQRAWQWITLAPWSGVSCSPSRGHATEIRQFANSPIRQFPLLPCEPRRFSCPRKTVFPARQWHSACLVVWVWVCVCVCVPPDGCPVRGRPCL